MEGFLIFLKGCYKLPGQNVDIGFVYSLATSESKKTAVKQLIRFLQNWGFALINVYASKDIDGEEYIDATSAVEAKLNNPEQLDYVSFMLAEMYYGMLIVNSGFLGQIIQGIQITQYEDDEKANGCYCISMSIQGEQIIPGCDLMFSERYSQTTNDFINAVTDKLVSFMKAFYQYSNYSYAFCDAEAAMECTPEALATQHNEVYSVAVVPEKQGDGTVFDVRKSSWNIDGFSQRYEPV